MDKRPIGIFDSGVGGLTVVDKVHQLLPSENIIYFGDTARVPYGNKSQETITRFSREIVHFLLGFNVKCIIVACNTASSLSLTALQRTFAVPIIGVIKPGVEEAIKASKAGRIGIIGTEATISSNAYKKEIVHRNKRCYVAQKSCPLLVPLAENGWLKDDITVKVTKRYLTPILKKKIDTLILGCTHYPLLKGVVRRIVGKRVALIDSSIAVANYTKELLEKERLLHLSGNGKVKFFTSDDTRSFRRLTKVFLRQNIRAEKVVI